MAKINSSGSLTINAPADKIWSIVADDFGKIGEWATAIDNAVVIDGGPALDGIEDTARACTIPGFGTTEEFLVHFDADNRELGYSVDAADIPAFVTNMVNSWEIADNGDGTSTVTTRITADSAGLLGALTKPMMMMQFAKTRRGVLADLKHYSETGKISDAKRVALAKAGAAA